MCLLWNRVTSESNNCSPMLRAIILKMAVQKIVPSLLIHQKLFMDLKTQSNMTVAPFDFNSKKDVAEILQIVLDELKRLSLAPSSLISNTQRTTVSCNICPCFSVSELNIDILHLQVPTDIQTSLN